MPCEGGYSNGTGATDSTELNPSVLLNYGKTVLLVVKVCHVDVPIHKSWATEKHETKSVRLLQLKWLIWIWAGNRRGGLFRAQLVHGTSGHQGRVATYRWAHRWVEPKHWHYCTGYLSMWNVLQSSRPSTWNLSGMDEDGWKINMGRSGRLTISHFFKPSQKSTKCLQWWKKPMETYPMPHTTTKNTILGLETQVSW